MIDTVGVTSLWWLPFLLTPISQHLCYLSKKTHTTSPHKPQRWEDTAEKGGARVCYTSRLPVDGCMCVCVCKFVCARVCVAILCMNKQRTPTSICRQRHICERIKRRPRWESETPHLIIKQSAPRGTRADESTVCQTKWSFSIVSLSLLV